MRARRGGTGIDGIAFEMPGRGKMIRCQVTRKALNDRAGTFSPPDIRTFNRFRDEIEEVARRKIAVGDEAPIIYSRDLNSDDAVEGPE